MREWGLWVVWADVSYVFSPAGNGGGASVTHINQFEGDLGSPIASTAIEGYAPAGARRAGRWGGVRGRGEGRWATRWSVGVRAGCVRPSRHPRGSDMGGGAPVLGPLGGNLFTLGSPCGLAARVCCSLRGPRGESLWRASLAAAASCQGSAGTHRAARPFDTVTPAPGARPPGGRPLRPHTRREALPVILDQRLLPARRPSHATPEPGLAR
jgi:hypothetical protein